MCLSVCNALSTTKFLIKQAGASSNWVGGIPAGPWPAVGEHNFAVSHRWVCCQLPAGICQSQYSAEKIILWCRLTFYPWYSLGASGDMWSIYCCNAITEASLYKSSLSKHFCVQSNVMITKFPAHLCKRYKENFLGPYVKSQHCIRTCNLTSTSNG